MKRCVHICLVLLLGILAFGCGDTEKFNITEVSNQFQEVELPPASGQVGEVQLNTILASTNQVLNQSVALIEDQVVPVFVTHYRITGFDADGRLIYAVQRLKNASILLSEVPVETVNLRIELLADNLVVGGLSTAVTIVEGETFLLNNPAFLFPGIASDEPGPPGPPGPPGAPVPISTAYGMFTFDRLNNDDEPLDVFPQDLLNFPTELVAVGGVTADSGQNGVYSVEQAGDYLFTYSLDLRRIFNMQGREDAEGLLTQEGVDEFERLNLKINDAIANQVLLGAGFGEQTVNLQAIVSLEPGDEISLQFCANEFSLFGLLELNRGTFTIARLGASSGAVLPEIEDECPEPSNQLPP